MKHGSLIALLALATLFAAGGAACPRILEQYTAPAPVVFEEAPSKQRVITAVNANSQQIQQLQATGATLSAPGIPSLRVSSLSYERPRRFRLIADTSLTGVELDMGSNDEQFWMWVKRNRPPSIYFCRHDQFHASRVREVMPIEPTWLAEALGVVYLDPAGRHEGPYDAGEGRLEIRTRIPTSDGDMTKVTILHGTLGWVLQQHIYDAGGRCVASAVASEHRYDLVTNVTLPRKVQINLPTMEMAFTLEIDDYVVNSIAGDPASLWTMPQRGDAQVDLGQIMRQPLPQTTPEYRPSPQPQPAPRFQQAPPPRVNRSFYERNP